MLEAIEKLLKEYKKNLQKMSAQATAMALVQKKGSLVKKTKKSGETESESAKNSITSATSGLGETVKGQFGKKVTQVLDEQGKMLDKF
ncbi:hypothetical protein ATZ33_15355 [Enterococcus silesiacus]|uniref:CsbD-like domain-containing protein n=1 Tax=Enterococcus silesiacus TaxID=332949 RepID=A0A0S3KEN5_9ENTE|nr:hypothetical protein [Enterococcus silesiacus]ALS02702.1 hypothetical protein ATZ33_15355 [Enterococcus silesiacus]OJG89745.1 hypothetical protein RV15_GL001586 [Enterococcus silesiacus]